jgi:hypothetical protein
MRERLGRQFFTTENTEGTEKNLEKAISVSLCLCGENLFLAAKNEGQSCS